MIYVVSQEGYLYAITSTGNFKFIFINYIYTYLFDNILLGSLSWRYFINSYRINYYVKTSPVIGSDGTIYIGSTDYYLYAITSTGNIKVI